MWADKDLDKIRLVANFCSLQVNVLKLNFHWTQSVVSCMRVQELVPEKYSNSVGVITRASSAPVGLYRSGSKDGAKCSHRKKVMLPPISDYRTVMHLYL